MISTHAYSLIKEYCYVTQKDTPSPPEPAQLVPVEVDKNLWGLIVTKEEAVREVNKLKN